MELTTEEYVNMWKNFYGISTTLTPYNNNVIHRGFPKGCFSKDGKVYDSMSSILENEVFDDFLENKSTCKYLISIIPFFYTTERNKLFKFLGENERIKNYSQDTIGNHFIQALIKTCNDDELIIIRDALKEDIVGLSKNRDACRVVQKLFIQAPSHITIPLIQRYKNNCFELSMSQNGNHVMSVVIKMFDFEDIEFIFKEFNSNKKKLIEASKDQFGCRVIQLSLKVLVSYVDIQKHQVEGRKQKVFSTISNTCKILLEHSKELIRHEFANYVIQQLIISHQLSSFLKVIIKDALTGNLFDLSREKFASHVIETALEHSRGECLRMLFDDLFKELCIDESEKSSKLNTLLTHQFGNYVIQRALIVSLDVKLEKQYGDSSWYKRLSSKITFQSNDVKQCATLKRILEIIDKQQKIESHNKMVTENPLLQKLFDINCNTTTGKINTNNIYV
ncbi:Maternal protein pumilio [Strongyloides ratti]|uniref:Maternal protein pumilio n=1 Tax=Strongyloides ratti TaxID=34506 RepID=A0A090LL04_STRRB|nr:Maternal protein pumilio [Strongyloides ratti]CEF70395.1 Maternal protein pumilio [Strongyloides ratti]